MLILFINAHKKNEEGSLRFKHFYNQINGILKSTIYFGNEITQTIRNYDQLSDYIYDQISFRVDEKAKQKFQSLQYIIIDGCPNFAPWTNCMSDVLLLIRKCIEGQKKLLCNGYAHFASYFYLSTKFNKNYTIATSKTKNLVGPIDFDYDEKTGHLLHKGKKICHSGIRVAASNRLFSDKSSNAVSNGIILSSKFDYVTFDSKSGRKITKDIESPFTFFWKNKIFCTPKAQSQAKADILYTTESEQPLAFCYKNMLSCQGLCPQFLKLIKNWICDQTERKIVDIYDKDWEIYHSIAFQNKVQYRKTITNPNPFLMSRQIPKRPMSSKFATVQFQKPSIRCSGKYQTLQQRYLHEQLQKKYQAKGRNRMNFHGKLDQTEIKNYVQRTPSRPASSHKFRQVSKKKWISKADFYNC